MDTNFSFRNNTNKKYEEIAEITGITQNYVRVKMNRIKKKLKKYMNH